VDGVLEDDAGGIQGLVQLLASEHGEAIEYDLLMAGLRLRWLGSRRLSWRDLLVFVRGAPRTSAYLRSVGGEQMAWGPMEHLTASLIDVINMQRWEHPPKSRQLGPKPTLVQRPGHRPEGTQLGSDPILISAFDAWWDS
jgi:hypothetical protein